MFARGMSREESFVCKVIKGESSSKFTASWYKSSCDSAIHQLKEGVCLRAWSHIDARHKCSSEGGSEGWRYLILANRSMLELAIIWVTSPFSSCGTPHGVRKTANSGRFLSSKEGPGDGLLPKGIRAGGAR